MATTRNVNLNTSTLDTNTTLTTVVGSMPTGANLMRVQNIPFYRARMRTADNHTVALIISPQMMESIHNAVRDGHLKPGNIRVLTTQFVLRDGNIGHMVHAMDMDGKNPAVCPTMNLPADTAWEDIVEHAYRQRL